MKYMKIRKSLYMLLAGLLASCGFDDPDNPDIGKEEIDADDVTRTVLVYAVNRSSLKYDFNDDRGEMLRGLENLDLRKHQLLLYYAESDGSCSLYRGVRQLADGSVSLDKIKSFDDSRLSTDPKRIEEVMDYALTVYPNSAYDLVLWGHGMSWFPYFTDHIVYDSPTQYAYGGEYNGSGPSQTDWTEIDELANAIPDHRFDTIWFDCCYMSGIEVIYQFRNKCKTFVGYPTEVWQYGLPYDLVLPYLMSDAHDVVGAAAEFYRYYSVTADPVTVAVCDMAAVENVAEASSHIMAAGQRRPSRQTLLNYSRTSGAPFYDFRQLMTETAIANDREDLAAVFRGSLEAMVLYHAESDRNFNKRPWDTSKISGVSVHLYTGADTSAEAYYRTLDWFRRVY